MGNKFSFIDDEPEDKPKKTKAKLFDEEKRKKIKANVEAYEFWEKFHDEYAELYRLKIQGSESLIEEVKIVMKGFQNFGLSYETFDSVMKHQMDRPTWMIFQVRNCRMLQVQAKILSEELERRY